MRNNKTTSMSNNSIPFDWCGTNTEVHEGDVEPIPENCQGPFVYADDTVDEATRIKGMIRGINFKLSYLSVPVDRDDLEAEKKELEGKLATLDQK